MAFRKPRREKLIFLSWLFRQSQSLASDYKLDCFELWCKMKIYRQYRWLWLSQGKKIGWTSGRRMKCLTMYEWNYITGENRFFMLIARVKFIDSDTGEFRARRLRVLVSRAFWARERKRMRQCCCCFLQFSAESTFNTSHRRCCSCTNTIRSRIVAGELTDIEERNPTPCPAFFIKKSLASLMFDNPFCFPFFPVA